MIIGTIMTMKMRKSVDLNVHQENRRHRERERELGVESQVRYKHSKEERWKKK